MADSNARRYLLRAANCCLLIAGLAFYALLGGVIFKSIEEKPQLEKWSAGERQLQRYRHALSQSVLTTVSNKCTHETAKGSNNSACLQLIDRLAYDFERKLLAGNYVENGRRNRWTIANSAFYSFTLITTIGYGNIACETFLGRLVTIIYAFIGVPYTFFVMAHLGQHLATLVLHLWNNHLRVRRTLRQTITCRKVSFHKTKSIPILVAAFIVTVNMLICAALLNIRKKEFDFLTSIYFVFITHSTIGLGDVTITEPDLPTIFVVSIGMLFGLTLVSMSVHLIQRKCVEARAASTVRAESAYGGITAGQPAQLNHQLDLPAEQTKRDTQWVANFDGTNSLANARL